MALLDDFNRADGPVYSGGGSSVWTADTVGGGTGLTTVNGNQMACSSAGMSNVSAFSLGADFDVRAALNVGGGFVAFYMSLASATSGGWEGLLFSFGLPSGADFSIKQRVSGSLTTVVDAPGVGSLGPPVFVRVRRVGNAVSMYRSADGVTWVELCSGTTSAVYQAGPMAIELGSTAVRMDDLTDAYVAVVAPVNTAAPVVSGTPQVGQTLSATTGSWDNLPDGYAYQWQRRV